MNSKLSLALRVIIMILVSAAFIMYLLATATDHWQMTKYKVNLHSVAILSGHGSSNHKHADAKDLYKYQSSHSGLWRGCVTLSDKKICAVLNMDKAWIRAVRAFIALALVSIIVVVVFVIATFFRRDLIFKFPGVMSFITAIFGLLAMAVYTGKSGVPTDNKILKSNFAWSFILGWLAWVLNVIAGLLCFLVPDEFEKITIKLQAFEPKATEPKTSD